MPRRNRRPSASDEGYEPRGFKKTKHKRKRGRKYQKSQYEQRKRDRHA